MNQAGTAYVPAEEMLPLVGEKEKKYREYRDVCLEILKTVVGLIGSIGGALPAGGAFVSQFLQNIQVITSCNSSSLPN
jgi:hypothetical protein